KAIERRVPGDHRTQEGRLRPEFSLVVHEERHVFLGIGQGGFLRKGIPEQFNERRDVDELRRLKVKHAVGIEEQEREVLASWVVQRVERSWGRLHLPA